MVRIKQLLTGVAFLGLAGGFATQGYAQDVRPPLVSDVPEEPIQAAPEPSFEAEPAPDPDTGQIIVTGSRIARRDYSSASPIVTLGTERLQQSGKVTLDQTINQLPQLLSGTNGSSQNNRAGRASLNLRGLGEARNLVLLDGRRIQPGDQNGAVDINLIPTLAVENIETITGGASAVYGSDAMSGVINFKLRRSFSGLMVDAQQAITERGDGSANEISIMAGSDFADDRGNALFLVSYATRDPVFRSQRDFSSVSTLVARFGNPILTFGGTAPTQPNVDAIFSQYGTPAGGVNRTTGIGVNPDGTLFTPAPGAGRNIVNYRGPLDDVINVFGGNLQQNTGYYYNLVNPLERFSAFGKIRYNITDSIEAFVQFLHTRYSTGSRTSAISIGTTGSTATIPTTNPFIRGDLRRYIDLRTGAGRNDPIPVVYQFDGLGLAQSDSQWEESQGVVGIGGDLGFGDLTWSAYGSYGRSSNTVEYQNFFSISRVQQLFDRPDGGAGLCAGGLDIFGPAQNISQACIDYIRADPLTSLVYDQKTAEVTLQGSLFDLPGGTLAFSVGADYRDESYDYDVDGRVNAGDIPGIIEGASSGSRSVKEVFGELLIPILKDFPLVQSLEANVGYRYSDYAPGGGVESYTANLDWAVTQFLRLRGGYSRAIRAPSLEDLYAATSQAQLRLNTPGLTNTNGDPCDTRTSFRAPGAPNAAAIRQLCLGLGVPASNIDNYNFGSTTVFGTSAGNPNLSAETADTYSVGAVFEAPFSSGLFSRLRGSVDYFNIRITDAVGQLPLATALARCFNLEVGSNPNYSPTNPNCAYFPRNPATGQIDAAFAPLLNLGQYRTSGVDFQVDWQIPLSDYLSAGLGTLQLNVVGTYLESFEIQTIQGSAVLDYAGSSQSPIDPNGRASVLPKWKAVSSLGYSQGPFRGSVSWRYVDKVFDSSLVTNPASTTPGVPAKSYFDLAASYRVTERAQVRMAVNNLLDTQPPEISATLGNTDTTTYDLLGRSFVIGVQTTF